MVAAAKVFTEVIGFFDTKWILGLTASPNRDDGLYFIVEANTGPILYSANIFDSEKLGSSIIPELKVEFLKKDVPYIFKKTESYHKVAESVLGDKNVIKYIGNKIFDLYNQPNNYQLVITQKVEESKVFLDYLLKKGVKTDEIAMMLGETKMDERKKIIKEANEGKIKIIITSKIEMSALYKIGRSIKKELRKKTGNSCQQTRQSEVKAIASRRA